MRQSDINVSSFVKKENGAVRLYINNKIQTPSAYITYYTDKNRYKDFNDIGFNMYSVPIFFAKRTINEDSQFPPFADGLFENIDGGLTIFDREVDRIVSVNKDAYIFPRVNISLPKKWDDENLDELNFTGVRGKSPRPCFSSKKWLNDTKEYIRIFIEHVQNSKYAKNIVGYQIATGRTEEWMAFDLNGSQGKRSEEEFKKQVQIGNYKDNEIEYRKYLSNTIGNVICELSTYVKELTERKLIVGAFYGYTLTVINWILGHLGYENVLNCKDVDFICSPIAYWTGRSVGEDNPNMTALSSTALHGKLYFAENDTRTSLSSYPCDLPEYHTPIWLGPAKDKSIELIKMHFSRALCHSHAFWWFDMWGGWYADNDYMSLLKNLKEINDNSNLLPLDSVAEVAILIDEKSYCYVDADATINKIGYEFLRPLGKTSVVYDTYLSCDYEEIKDKYKAFIVIEPYKTDRLKEIEEDLQKNNIATFIINKDNCDITVKDFRSFFDKNGITVRFNSDAVVYENKSYFFVHTTEDCLLKEPKGLKLKGLTEGAVFPLKSKAGKSYLFQKI